MGIRPRSESLWIAIIASAFVSLLATGCETPTPTPTTPPPTTPTPAIPTPTPEPFTPSGVPDTRLGMAWISGFYGDTLAQGNERLAVAAGATWDRWPFQWWYIEPTPGNYQFNLYTAPDRNQINYTEGVDRDEDNGLQLLGILNGWAPHPGYGLDEWQTYVERVVTEFGDKVDAWEIGNEGSLPLHPDLDHAGYVEAVRVACEVLEAHGQSDKPILLGAPESSTALSIANEYFQSTEGDWEEGEADRWRKTFELLRDEGTMCLDGISLHAYGRPEHSYWVVAGVHGYVSAFWNPGVWLTETGVQHPQYPPTEGFPKTSWLGQASYVIQQYALALKGFHDAGIDENDPARAKIFHYSFADGRGGNDAPWGLIPYQRSDSPYPSYDAMKMVTAVLGEAAYEADESDDPDDTDLTHPTYRHLVFRDRNNRFVHVLWAVSGAVNALTVTPRGTDAGNCATLYYQPGDGTETDGYDGRFWKTLVSRNASGEFVLDLPASTEPNLGSEDDEHHPSPMIGGLYGLENSASFRARLEEYARRGGTIIPFAQQHGYEFSALPGATLPSQEGAEKVGVSNKPPRHEGTKCHQKAVKARNSTGS